MTEPTLAIYERPRLYPKQEAAIFHPARYAVIEASTKAGKTFGCLVWLFEQALQGGPRDHYWWLAPVQSQARIGFTRLKAALPGVIFTANESDHTVTLGNGATIWFKSAENPDHLFGEDVRAAVIDEATRVKEDSWHALRSTLTATQGPVRIIGNVRGRRNWAYTLARGAEAGAPDMHYARLTAADAVEAGVLRAAEVEDARRTLPEHVFRELYFAEPAESLSLIYRPFGPENVTEQADYVPGGGEVYVGYDWGFTEPTHIGLYQLRDGVLYQFDELVGAGRSERSWVEDVVRRICALPEYRGPTVEEWAAVRRGDARVVHWPEGWPEAAAGDPSAAQFRSEFRDFAIHPYSAKRVRHLITTGQDVLRALILSGEDHRRFFLHPRCVRTREALENYRAKELGDGQFDSRPADDVANHAYSHGPIRPATWPGRCGRASTCGGSSMPRWWDMTRSSNRIALRATPALEPRSARMGVCTDGPARRRCAAGGDIDGEETTSR